MTLKRTVAGIVALIAAVLFGATLAHALLDSDVADVEPTTATSAVVAATAQTRANPDSPMRLIIPSLGIDAHIQHVGIAKSGSMAVPTNFSDVAWYRNGSVPGESGSAVMAGHVDNALALPGVFKHLDKIQIGADVYVEAKNGTMTHFQVVDIKIYDASEAPAAEIFDADGPARLNLITCKGDWIQSERQYDQRLVVYTKMVE